VPVTTEKEPGVVGEITFTVQVFREGKLFVAHAPELDVSSAGETVEAAKAHLVEEAHRMGTLCDVLEEAGYERAKTGWKPRDLLVEDQARITVQ